MSDNKILQQLGREHRKHKKYEDLDNLAQGAVEAGYDPEAVKLIVEREKTWLKNRGQWIVLLGVAFLIYVLTTGPNLNSQYQGLLASKSNLQVALQKRAELLPALAKAAGKEAAAYKDISRVNTSNAAQSNAAFAALVNQVDLKLYPQLGIALENQQNTVAQETRKLTQKQLAYNQTVTNWFFLPWRLFYRTEDFFKADPSAQSFPQF